MASSQAIPDFDYLTSLLAHDISNYNQTIRGYLEMLLDEQMGKISEEQERALAICLRQSSRIQGLLDSVHLMGVLATTQVSCEEIDLDMVIQRAIAAVEREYADREVRTRFLPAGRKVNAEPYLEMIFTQLLSNAVRHNNTEVVEVDIRTAVQQGPPPTWQVQIADNGVGISPAQQELLFQRLDRREVHGSGLGLSLVRVILERSGGRIWLEQSSPAQGSVFALTLPALL